MKGSAQKEWVPVGVTKGRLGQVGFFVDRSSMTKMGRTTLDSELCVQCRPSTSCPKGPRPSTGHRGNRAWDVQRKPAGWSGSESG